MLPLTVGGLTVASVPSLTGPDFLQTDVHVCAGKLWFSPPECRVINSNWFERLGPAALLCTPGLLSLGDTGPEKKSMNGGGEVGRQQMEDVCKSTSMTDSLNQISGYLVSITHQPKKKPCLSFL